MDLSVIALVILNGFEKSVIFSLGLFSFGIEYIKFYIEI